MIWQYILYNMCIDTTIVMHPTIRCTKKRFLRVEWNRIPRRFFDNTLFDAQSFRGFPFFVARFPRLSLQRILHVCYSHDNVIYYSAHSFTSFASSDRKIKNFHQDICIPAAVPSPARERVLSVSRPEGLFRENFDLPHIRRRNETEKPKPTICIPG